MKSRFCSVPQTLEAVAAGRLIIVVDAEERENEGDFFIAAEKVTPEMLYFMIMRGCGQLCAPVAPQLARRLKLKPLVRHNPNLEATAFAVPIDHRACKTGISPQERVFTIHALIDPFSQPVDFVRPGHVFPLIAREQGVLCRPGHTEAAVDLARLAGLAPAGLLCEICSRDGRQMADGQELMQIADELDTPIITIEELIRFRQAVCQDSAVAPLRAASVPAV